MIPSINKPGGRTFGLLVYLYGPGKYEEHADAHLVASFDGMSPDPARDPDATLKDLQQLLDQPVQAMPQHARPAKHVWHTSVRTAPGDRALSDHEWAEVARRIVAATGVDPGDGQPGCRWAAIRHAADHIHIIATLVREDGRRPDDFRSGARAQAEARLIEQELGLRQVAPGDGTAAKRPTSAERHKAKRLGREMTPREELRETVRRAVAGTLSENEFFDRLTAAGLLLHKRVAPSGDVLGYKVAVPGDRNGSGDPVFYPASRLAPDLSLPRLRQRWSTDPLGHGDQVKRPEPAVQGPGAPAAARRRTAAVSWQVLLLLPDSEDAVAATYIAAAAEVLDALAMTSAAHTRRELRSAAQAFERASRSHIHAERGHGHALRLASRDLVRGGSALGRGEDRAATAMALDMMFFLVIAAAHWHAKKGHAQQATSAAAAADHLRQAYRSAASQPLGALRQRGRNSSAPMARRQQDILRRAVPDLADQILAEPGWYALAATLVDAETAGHDPTSLLTEAAGRRELRTAESMSVVLVWRVRRTAGLPADTTARLPSPGPASQPAADSTRRPMPIRPAEDHPAGPSL